MAMLSAFSLENIINNHFIKTLTITATTDTPSVKHHPHLTIMPVRISLTVDSLAAASVIIGATASLSGVKDFTSRMLTPSSSPTTTEPFISKDRDQGGYAHICSDEVSDDYDDDDDDDDDVSDVNEIISDDFSSDDGDYFGYRSYAPPKRVCEPSSPFRTLFDEDEADKYAAGQAAFAGYDQEWIDSLLRVAGVTADDESNHPARSCNDEEEKAQGSANITTSKADHAVWEKLESVSNELQETQTQKNALQAELQEIRVENAALHLELKEAEVEINTLQQELTAAGISACAAINALDIKELELTGTRRALQGLRDAHVRLISAIQDVEAKVNDDVD